MGLLVALNARRTSLYTFCVHVSEHTDARRLMWYILAPRALLSQSKRAPSSVLNLQTSSYVGMFSSFGSPLKPPPTRA